jgi:hypothetical protein
MDKQYINRIIRDIQDTITDLNTELALLVREIHEGQTVGANESNSNTHGD